MTIYVYNLNFQVESADLKNLFTPYGDVHAAVVAIDNTTKKSRGFGFVEMKEEIAGNKAIEQLNGQTVGGRTLVVKVSKPIERSYL